MPRAHETTNGRSLRIGIVDLFSPAPESWARQMFAARVESAAVALGADVDLVAYGVDVAAGPAAPGVDWDRLAECDGLVVTGGEPQEREMAAEPTLAFVERILDTAGDTVTSTLYSCQSAHAALHLVHGLRRVRLDDKYTGVFPHRVTDAGHPLVAGLTAPVHVPHSRWNAVPLQALRDAGPRPLLVTEDGQWHLATSGDGLRHVYCQGHPEYLRDTLLSEYRRDLRRCAAGTVPHTPRLPAPYFTDHARGVLQAFADKLTQDRRPELMDRFPEQEAMDGVGARWQAESATFFSNWLRGIAEAAR